MSLGQEMIIATELHFVRNHKQYIQNMYNRSIYFKVFFDSHLIYI